MGQVGASALCLEALISHNLKPGSNVTFFPFLFLLGRKRCVCLNLLDRNMILDMSAIHVPCPKREGVSG